MDKEELHSQNVSDATISRKQRLFCKGGRASSAEENAAPPPPPELLELKIQQEAEEHEGKVHCYQL